ncbi:MAG: hypothetical protein JRH20_28680 [Deltaproteobacteria bacterium]|nr:hypothetical protein [Deltaproteobacteria bacterium]
MEHWQLEGDVVRRSGNAAMDGAAYLGTTLSNTGSAQWALPLDAQGEHNTQLRLLVSMPSHGAAYVSLEYRRWGNPSWLALGPRRTDGPVPPRVLIFELAPDQVDSTIEFRIGLSISGTYSGMMIDQVELCDTPL